MELIETQSQSSSGHDRFRARLARTGQYELRRKPVSILQVNLGKLCNQACKHCHVEAGPKRTEIMTWEVMERLIVLAAHPHVCTVDLTGGAPEMNPHFRELVERLRGLDKELIIRCNLTIVEEPGYAWLPEFYAANQARLICSLPCYGRENVEKQRGKGIFDKSISALKKLNAMGYAAPKGAGRLTLDLVYNPLGPYLPPAQPALEAEYREVLGNDHGVYFDNLLTLANLPIGRFRQSLSRQGQLEPYLGLLEDSFNSATVDHLMCRNTLSVGYDGRIYDCDFNQMLDMEICTPGESARISILDPAFRFEDLQEIPIATGEHCLGCTAGAGSSCGGALTG